MAKMDKELTSLVLDGPEEEYMGEVVSWEELEAMTGKTREWFERKLERILLRNILFDVVICRIQQIK